MVKPKQRHANLVSDNKKKIQGVPEVDPDHGDWMMVKKQRIIIVIPALPSLEQPMLPVTGESQPQETPRKASIQPPCPPEILPPQQLAHQKEKSLSPSPEQPSVIHPSQPILTSQNPSTPTHNSLESPRNSLRYGNNLSVRRSPKVSEGSRILDLSCGFLNGRMKASYLERKLKTAGGLENWLVSLGLGRFIKIFKRSRVDKFHLANLTMEKLKDMGAETVGPRRKLLHAIDCLCEPHCFRRA